MMPANSTGPRIADTQNHFVRTRSTNSRRMTAHTLCTGSPVACAGRGRCGSLRAHQVHEDLVEGGTRQLEPRETCSGIDQRLEDLLGIGPGIQLQFRLLAEVLHLGYQSPVSED